MASIPLIENLRKSLNLSIWQIVFLGVLIVFSVNYLTMIFIDKFRKPLPIQTSSDTTASATEGFQDMAQAEESKYDWLDNEGLYDNFYASIYDQLVQASTRTQAEVKLLLGKWKIPGRKQNEYRILDIGCGTGITALAFAKEGVGKVVGLDNSQAMLDRAAKHNIPKSVLTPQQKSIISLRKGTAIDSNICSPQEFDCATLFYFTIYYFRDMDVIFRNLSLWVKPGGKLAIQVVNKFKFDPILDSASPFAFSIQKYSKDRVTKSKVHFDKFDYEASFNLDEESESNAEFRETFRFKDGSVRRQRHTFNMPNISVIVNKAKAAGWIYEGFIDEQKIGFEYSYLLLFTH
jgi:ubiquinone/menaquinone biosynthesis C-methylase UbiE